MILKRNNGQKMALNIQKKGTSHSKVEEGGVYAHPTHHPGMPLGTKAFST